LKQIKDSGKRQEYKSGMVRDIQDGKANFFLLLPKGMPYEEQLLTRCGYHLTNGAKKYSERNWELAEGPEELERFKASAFRHFVQWIAGEEDEDHAAAVVFNINAAEYLKWKMKQNG